jgi:8-oxo-dGTP diphosphatase
MRIPCDTAAVDVRTVAEIDWNAWVPTDRATLTFLVRDGQALLIRKKRGLGAGKVNAPGGRLEHGESIEHCAIREVREEVGVRVAALERLGELRFQFSDGYSTWVTVFRTAVATGDPVETEEALPFLCALDAIPYDEMWEDDRLWIPALLRGECFEGRFLFDGDRMLDHVLQLP